MEVVSEAVLEFSETDTFDALLPELLPHPELKRTTEAIRKVTSVYLNKLFVIKLCPSKMM